MKLNIAKDELDFAQKSTLNEDFWQNEKLNPKVRKVILAIVKNYLKSTNLRLSIDDIDEIEFTGSLANYNHNKFSDVDIHLLFDFSELGNDPDFMRELLTAKAINWNNRHNVTIFGHEVELYIADAKSDHHSTGVYSVKDDKWLIKPVKDAKLSAELNLNKVKDKADKISKQIDMLAVKDDVSLEKIESLKDKIKKMRESGLETGGEYSTENLAFKLLRRRGELNTLYALMNQAQDEELSLDEGTEWWKKRRKLDNKNYRELMGYVRGAKVSKKGKPYMVNPHMKLPKSGPPGVGALEEETKTVERKIQLSSSTPVNTLFDKYIDRGTPVTINFYADDEGCLGEHSYVVQRQIGYYSVNLVGDLKNVVKPSSPIEDPRKCLYRQVGRENNEYAVLDMFEDIRKAGSVKNFEVTVFEKVDVTPSAPISVEKPKPKRNIFQKLIKESGEIELVLIPKKEIYFDNSPGLFEQMTALWNSISIPEDIKPTTIVPWIRKTVDKFKDSLKPRFGKEMDYILYSPKTEYVLTLRQTGYSITQTSRNDTYGSLFLDNMSDIIKELPPLGTDPVSRRFDRQLRAALIKILQQMADKLKGSNESNNFTKKELLDQINQSIYSNPTAFIDFDNSSVKQTGKNPISLTRYLLGRKSLGIISVSLQQGFMSSLSSDEYKKLSKSVQKYNQQDYTQYKLVVGPNTYEFSNTYGGKQQVDKGVIHGLQTLTNNSDIKSTVNNVMLAYQKGLDRSELNKSFFDGFQGWYDTNGTYGKVAIEKMSYDKQTDVISKIKNTKDKDVQQSLKEDLIRYASQNPLYIFGDKEIPELKDKPFKVILARGVTSGGIDYSISESDLTKLPVNKGAFVTGRAFVANPSIQQALVQNGTRFGFKELGGGVWIMDPKWAEKFRNANLKGGANKLFKSSIDEIKGLSPLLRNSLKRIEKYFYAIKGADRVKIDYSKEDLTVEVNGIKLEPAVVFSTLMKGIAEDQLNPGRVLLSTGDYDKDTLSADSKVFYDVGKFKGCKPRVGAEFKFSCKTISLGNDPIKIKTGTKVFITKCGNQELNGGKARVEKVGDNTYKISACTSKTKIIEDNLLKVPKNVTFNTTKFVPDTVEVTPGEVGKEGDLTQEEIKKYFSFSQEKDVNSKTFNEQTTKELRDELVKLAILAQDEFGPDTRLDITEAYKESNSGTHVGGSQHYKKTAVDFNISGQDKLTTSAFTLAQIYKGQIKDNGFGVYFDKNNKVRSTTHYDVRGSRSMWKWVDGKKQKQFSKFSKESKKDIVDGKLFKLPEDYRKKLKEYL